MQWRKQFNLTDIFLLSSGLFVAAVLSFTNNTRWAVWFDEAFSEHLTRHSFIDIARYTASDVHPPLYYWLLKVWRMLWGDSELALRSLSLVCLLATMVVMYYFVRRYFSRGAAGIVIVLTAISPMLFRYGLEARMYTLVLLIVVLASTVLMSAVERPATKKWMAYGILVGLGMLTHYLSLVVWVSHLVWYLYIHRKPTVHHTIRAALRTRGFAIGLLTAFLTIVPWLPMMVWQVINIQGGGFWIGPVSMVTLPNLASNAYAYLDANEATGWIFVGLLLLYGLTGIMVYRTVKQLRHRQQDGYVFLLMSAVLPAGLLIVGSLPPLRSSFVDRYLLSSIGMWFMVVGVAISTNWNTSKRLSRIVLVATCLALVAGCIHVMIIGNLNKDNGGIHTMNAAMKLVNDNASIDEPIIADSSWKYYEASYYETSNHRVYFISEDATKNGAYAMLRDENDHKITDLAAFGREHPIAWYVSSQWSREGASYLPKGWRQLKVLQPASPSKLRATQMEYVGG